MRGLARYMGGVKDGFRSLADVVDTTYRWVFATEFLVLLTLLALLKIAASVLTEQEFGEFMLVRSALTLAYPVILLGLGVAVPRYISLASAREDWSALDAYWSGALLIWASSAGIAVVAILALPDLAAILLLGTARHSNLTTPMGVMLIGFSWHALVYGYFRGRLLMGRANLLQVANTSLVPLLSLGITQELPEYFLLTAAGWMVVPTIALVVSRVSFRFTGVTERLAMLLSYGVRRVPGDFFLVGLLSIPVIVVSNIAGALQAGYVSLGMTIVGLLGAALTPLSIVLLPRSTRAFALADDADLRREIKFLMLIIGASGVLFLPVTFFLAEPVLVRFLGERFAEAGSVVPFVLAAAWPYAFFVVLRSVMDARHRRAINTRNGAIALAVLAVFCAVAVVYTRDVNTVLIGFDLAMLTLGALTVFEVWSVFRDPSPDSRREELT